MQNTNYMDPSEEKQENDKKKNIKSVAEIIGLSDEALSRVLPLALATKELNTFVVYFFIFHYNCGIFMIMPEILALPD